MIIKTVGMCAVFAVLMMSGSCIIALLDTPGYLSVYQRHEEFLRRMTLEAGGTLALENREGVIEISGWDREECEIYAKKEIPDPVDWRFWIANESRFMPDIEIDRFDDFITIQTVAAPADIAANVVDYFIRVPESVNLERIVNRWGDISIFSLYGRVQAETREGNITVDNFSGSLEAATASGDILVWLYDARKEDEVTLSSQDGDIVLTLEADVDADLEIFAPNGKIFNEFGNGDSPAKDKVSFRLGDGGAWISLSAMNGDVRISKMDQAGRMN